MYTILYGEAYESSDKLMFFHGSKSYLQFAII